MADGRDKKGKKVHVFEGGHKAVLSLIWSPRTGIAAEG